MISSHLQHSRYLSKARAAYAARLIAAGAIIAVPTACGNSDEAAFTTATTAAAATTAPAATQAAATQAPAAATEAPAATATATDAPASSKPTASASTGDSGTAIPAGTNLNVEFTFTASGGKNPYIATWVEDADGNIVQTISLWYESGKGDKWLNDLTSWYNAASGSDVTTSGATRAPGTFSVAWDGTDLSGAAAPQGIYTIFVESAVERGNHSITSAEVDLDGGLLIQPMTDNGDLTDLSVFIA